MEGRTNGGLLALHGMHMRVAPTDGSGTAGECFDRSMSTVARPPSPSVALARHRSPSLAFPRPPLPSLPLSGRRPSRKCYHLSIRLYGNISAPVVMLSVCLLICVPIRLVSVCMYICMYLYMYVVCMYCMCLCLYACMYVIIVCMYVCILA